MNKQLDSLSLYKDLISLNQHDLRSQIRANSYQGHTAGLAAGRLQANLAIIPEQYALDFMRFCHRNPKPCPLSGVSDTGNPMMHTMGADIDIRTDVPAYNIYRNGVFDSSVLDIKTLWQDDFVSFALGCSFTFEHEAMRAGIKFGHIENNTTVPMFRSTIKCVSAGVFSGTMAVSMRAINNHQIDLVTEISSKYPLAHGAPIHIGNPREIGIEDVYKPQWGDAVPIKDDQTAVFWACGVTPQIALENARIPIVITHKPGHMLISDIDECAENPILQPKL
ncbi:MAG: putative hydro-lyase [Alphaproteobacteria bacterium]|nr:putative hydro-lyase [Alphaproteobacteria bacterium]